MQITTVHWALKRFLDRGYNLPSDIIPPKIYDQGSEISQNKAIGNYLDVTLLSTKAS